MAQVVRSAQWQFIWFGTCASSVPATSTKARNSASLGALEAEVQGRRAYIGVRFLIHSFIHSLTHAFTRSSVHSACRRTISGPAVPAYTCAMRPGHAFCYMLPEWRCNSFHTLSGDFFFFVIKIALWVQCGGKKAAYLSEKRIKAESGAAARALWTQYWVSFP